MPKSKFQIPVFYDKKQRRFNTTKDDLKWLLNPEIGGELARLSKEFIKDTPDHHSEVAKIFNVGRGVIIFLKDQNQPRDKEYSEFLSFEDFYGDLKNG